MDVEAFGRFLTRGGRSANAAQRVMEYVKQFEEYLAEHHRAIDDANPAELESFVAAIEAEPGASAKLHLWGIAYYYDYLDDAVMVHVARTMRRERIEQTPFRLREFRGIDLTHTDLLAAVGIRSVDELLAAAATKSDRAALAGQTNVPPAALEELVRLADLARIGGIEAIRARLYLDAGIRSVADLARWDPIELVALLRQYVAATDFDGIAPLPGEARHAVETARRLDPIIEW